LISDIELLLDGILIPSAMMAADNRLLKWIDTIEWIALIYRWPMRGIGLDVDYQH